jgi:hypothetical protein
MPSSAGSTTNVQGGTIVQSGSLSITPSTSLQFNGYTTLVPYNVKGKAFSIKVTQAASSSTGTVVTAIGLHAGSANWYRWIISGTTFLAQSQVFGGSITTQFSTTYNSTTHAYWRIRESSKSIFWDTSTDGITWTQRATIGNQINTQGLYAEAWAGTTVAATVPVAAIFNLASIA